MSRFGPGLGLGLGFFHGRATGHDRFAPLGQYSAYADQRDENDESRQGRDCRAAPCPLHRLLQTAGRPRQYRAVFQPGPQILSNGLGTDIAPSRVLFQALQADYLHVARHPGIELARPLGGFSLTIVSVSTTLSPVNGAWPVRSVYKTEPSP